MNKKSILIGVTGGIAAYKALDIVSYYRKKNYDVTVIMSKNATEFVQPLAFETISNNKVYTDTFDRDYKFDVEHVSLAKKADIFCVVPATANFIAKAAHGLADDMLTTTFLAATCPKIICPAMNTNMYNNPITLDNISICQKYGMEFVDSCSGILACGDVGKGRLAPVTDIIDAISYHLYPDSLKGKKVLVTAGGTEESIDPVRIITNHSTGKMGFAIAKMARSLKAEVTVVAASVSADLAYDINRIDVKSSEQMFNAVTSVAGQYDYIVMAAAVSDFTPEDYRNEKIKKDTDTMTLELRKTKDILKHIGLNRKANQLICGFAMESENLIANAEKKLNSKNIDLIVANNIKNPDAGFAKDSNVATLISKTEKRSYDKMSKEELGLIILNQMKEIENATDN